MVLVMRKSEIEKIRYVRKQIKVPQHKSIPYSDSWSRIVPTAGGIYLIHDLRGVLYIGRTNNIKRRFTEHLSGSSNYILNRAMITRAGTLFFSWNLSELPEQRNLETLLIKQFNPVCNRQI